MSRAITALSAQDDVRDRALEEAAGVADGFTCGGCGMDGKAGRAIRALKSKPATSTADPVRVYVRRTAPGTTGAFADTRTGEVDRRKSRDGCEFGAKTPQFLRHEDTYFGRRANDRARWAQPPAPEVKQGLREAFEGRFGCTVGEFETHCARRQPSDHVVLAWLIFMLSNLRDTRLGGKL